MTLHIETGITRNTNKINKEANERANIELKARLRPEIEFLDTKPVLDTGSGRFEMRVIGTMKNIGAVPAVDIRAIFAETEKTYLRDIVWQKEKEAIFTKSLSYGSLPQGAEVEFMFRMEWSANKASANLAVWLEYNYEDIAKARGEKLMLCHVSGGGTMTIERFLQPEIVEVRKRVQSVQFAHEL